MNLVYDYDYDDATINVNDDLDEETIKELSNGRGDDDV